jgi:hypothetical protein
LKPDDITTDGKTDTENENRREAVQKAASKQTRINQEMRKLDSSFNPTSMEKQMVVETDNKGKEVAKQGHFIFLARSDHRVLEMIDQALYGPEKDKCTVSVASEIMNFIAGNAGRKCQERNRNK